MTAPRLAYSLDSLRSLAEDLRAQGQTVTTLIVSQESRRPPAWVADRLTVPPTGRLLRLERIRLLAGRPAVHQLSWVPEPQETPLAALDFSNESLYAILAAHGIVAHRASETLRPGLLDDDTAALLHHPAGAPVFVSERVTFDPADHPILLDRATILGTTMEIRTERAATGVSMRWSRQRG